MYSFKSDYSEGAHPKILEAFMQTNLEQTDGYGEDPHCDNAASLIKKLLKNEDVDIHFMVGGTPTNFTAISAFLRPHHAVVAPKTAHIFVHETGAVEATGHKVLALPTSNGKIASQQILDTLIEHEDEHMVKPKLVYISNTTEIGTVYTRSQLEELYKTCKENNLYLYMDGARLASALTSDANDLTIEDFPNLTDAFYIGGTKNGAMFGEVLVICNPDLKEDFRFHMKQKGCLLAKGRLLGVQFETLFKDNLWFENGRHANRMSTILKEGLISQGYRFLTDSPSNQLFPILPNSMIAVLEENYSFYIWKKIDESHSSIRLVTSWATEEEKVRTFLADLKKLK